MKRIDACMEKILVKLFARILFFEKEKRVELITFWSHTHRDFEEAARAR